MAPWPSGGRYSRGSRSTRTGRACTCCCPPSATRPTVWPGGGSLQTATLIQCRAAPCGSAQPRQRRRPPTRSTGLCARCSSHSPATRISPPNSASSTRPTPFFSSPRMAVGLPVRCRCPEARSGSCTRPTGNLSSPVRLGRSSSRRSPFGWDGWRLRLVSLENVQAVGLPGPPASGGSPGPAAAAARRSAARCRDALRLAGVSRAAEAAAPGKTRALTSRWHAEVRRAGGGTPLVGRALDPADETDIWEGVPHPVLGAFEVTVRGPLGRGAAPHDLRRRRLVGLLPATRSAC